MAEQSGAPKSAPPNPLNLGKVMDLSRRDQFAMAFGAALMGRQTRTPVALANEVVTFTDAFLERLGQ